MKLDELRDKVDVAIIGAGPAGLAAAAIAAGAGLDTLVIDENAGPGGQIYRAITTTPVKNRDVLGPDYWVGADLVSAARASGAKILQGTTVWSLDREFVIGLSRDGAARLVTARRVIIATGAQERPFPIPGWTLPGVMTAGAAQTMLKSSGLVPNGETVIAGTGPLLWLLASQLVRAGAKIAAILDTTPRGAYLKAAPHAAGFLLSPLFKKGLALRREVSAKVRVVSGVSDIRAAGYEKLASVTFTAGAGKPETLPVDNLLLHQGVVPNVNLAMAAGCAHQWDERQFCFVPTLDADGQSSVPGIYIAGDGAGIAGASAAEERGRVAAIAAVQALSPTATVPDAQAIRQRLARHERARSFLDTLFAPPRQFRVPQGDDTIVCRCEEVTAGTVREVARLGCEGPNQLKSFTRCGMGPCQGRLCGLTVTELISDTLGLTPQVVGSYRLRSPVKPISLGELARMPASEKAVKAVVR